MKVAPEERLATLFAIAEQCPLTGGDAVYAARSMISLLMDTFFFDDALCIPPSAKTVNPALSNDKAIEEIKVILFPNPAEDYTMLKLSKDITEKMQLLITDATGRRIKDESINVANGLYRIETSNLSNGLYFVTLYKETDKLFGGKLSIMNK